MRWTTNKAVDVVAGKFLEKKNSPFWFATVILSHFNEDDESQIFSALWIYFITKFEWKSTTEYVLDDIKHAFCGVVLTNVCGSRTQEQVYHTAVVKCSNPLNSNEN